MNGRKTETRNLGYNAPSCKKDGKREMAKIRRSETRRQEYKAKNFKDVDELDELVEINFVSEWS